MDGMCEWVTKYVEEKEKKNYFFGGGGTQFLGNTHTNIYSNTHPFWVGIARYRNS